jgi:hypothetical protein
MGRRPNLRDETNIPRRSKTPSFLYPISSTRPFLYLLIDQMQRGVKTGRCVAQINLGDKHSSGYGLTLLRAQLLFVPSYSAGTRNTSAINRDNP